MIRRPSTADEAGRDLKAYMVHPKGTGGDRSLSDRLDLLESAGVISTRARQLTDEAIGRIAAFVGAPLGEDEGGPLVTHVAMALTRVDRGEPEPALPDVVSEEIAGRAQERQLAETLASEWESVLGRPLPDSEVSYLIVHLAVLREKARLSA